MAKGPLVIEKIEVLIGVVYKKYPKWKAPAVRSEVSHILHINNPELPRSFPSLSTVQKVLAKIRKPHSDPQEKPWSMATLDQYPIPPEALPAVRRVMRWRVSCDEPFTIREAKWVSRLYTIFDVVEDQQDLMEWSAGLARREYYCPLLNKDFTTPDLDELVTRLEKKGPSKEYKPKTTIRDFIRQAKRTAGIQDDTEAPED